MIEAYVGEYASGKSEMAINRALELKSEGRQVTLVDLDTVEPFYTLRPIKERLEQEGLDVIGLSSSDSLSLIHICAVTVKVNGKQELISIKISPEAVDPDDVEMLEDLVVAAVNEGIRQSQDMVSTEMSKITGGLNIPGL